MRPPDAAATPPALSLVMAPFRQYIVKLHSRCNLSCTYCYVYHHVDQSRATGRSCRAPRSPHSPPASVSMRHGTTSRSWSWCCTAASRARRPGRHRRDDHRPAIGGPAWHPGRGHPADQGTLIDDRDARGLPPARHRRRRQPRRGTSGDRPAPGVRRRPAQLRRRRGGAADAGSPGASRRVRRRAVHSGSGERSGAGLRGPDLVPSRRTRSALPLANWAHPPPGPDRSAAATPYADG